MRVFWPHLKLGYYQPLTIRLWIAYLKVTERKRQTNKRRL